MVQRVITGGEISINELPYRLNKPPRFFSASQLPPKYSLGARSKDDEPFATVVEWNDWRGGIGMESIATEQDVNRAWHSECYLRARGHLVLPPLVTRTNVTGPSDLIVLSIGELGGHIYTAFQTELQEYDVSDDDWTSRATLADTGTPGFLTARMSNNGTVTAMQPAINNIYYSTNGSSWAADTTNATYLAFWDERVWAIDGPGQLRYLPRSEALGGTWVVDAKLPLPDSYIKGLFVGPDAAGESILYAATQVGLFAHDAANSRFVKTALEHPYHEEGGFGTTVWRGDIYYPVGLGIYRYHVGSPSSITAIGPDRDAGMETGFRADSQHLIAAPNELLALQHVPSGQYATILSWDGQGWQILWVADVAGQTITAAHVSDVEDEYRLYFGYRNEMYYMGLQKDLNSPLTLATYKYEDGDKYHITPWVQGVGETNIALRVVVGTANISTSGSDNETVDVDYAINQATGWTSLGTISTDGTTQTTYNFPNDTTPSGTSFETIRFRLTLDRGSTNTKSPDVTYLKFIYLPKRAMKWGLDVELNLYKDKNGRSPFEQLADLRTAAESDTLVEVTYRDDQGTGDPRNYYMVIDPQSAAFSEQTGYDERGIASMRMFEP